MIEGILSRLILIGVVVNLLLLIRELVEELSFGIDRGEVVAALVNLLIELLRGLLLELRLLLELVKWNIEWLLKNRGGAGGHWSNFGLLFTDKVLGEGLNSTLNEILRESIALAVIVAS